MGSKCKTESVTPDLIAYCLAALFGFLLLLTAYMGAKHVKAKYYSKARRKAKAKAAVTSTTTVTATTTLNSPTTPNVAGHELVPSREATPEPMTPDSVTVDIDIEDDAQDVSTGNVTEPALEMDGDEVAEMEEENEWHSMSAGKKLWEIGLDMWCNKAIYLSPVFHLSDTSTDWASVVEFYLTARDTDPEDCNDLDMWKIFYLSAGALVLYRVIAVIFIFRISRRVTGKVSWLSVALQTLDLELYRMLYRSHTLELSGSSNPQELLGMIEAVFEGAIQTTIQFVYLFYVPGSGSWLIRCSAGLSLLNLCRTIASNDLWAVKATFLTIVPVNCGCGSLTLYLPSPQFIKFHLFRFMDISCRLAFYVVFWVAGSGLTTFCYVLSNFVFGLVIYLWQSMLEHHGEHTYSGAQTEMLMLPMSSPMFFGKYSFYKDFHKKWQWRIVYCYLVIEVVVMSCLLWKNTEINEQSDVVIWIAGLATFGSVVRCLVLFVWRFDGKSKWDESKERGSYSDLLTQYQWQSALENILFSASIHDTVSMNFKASDACGYSLFHIACGIGNESLLRKVWEETPPSMRIKSLKMWPTMWRVLKHGGNSTESKMEQLEDLLNEEWDGIRDCDWELSKTRSPPETVREYFDLIVYESGYAHLGPLR